MNDDMLKPARRTVANSRLTCSQCERMILDAIDGTLLPEDKAQFDLHILGCPSCSKAMEEAQKGSAWLEMLKIAPPEPPSLLLENILARTSGDPAIAVPVLRGETILGGVRQGYPAGHRADVLPFQVPASRNWAARAVHAVMQPRFAMTAAMAFFSIALTMNLTGVSLSDLHASSFTPSNLRHGFWSANNRVVQYYDSLRVVYELESRVRELQKQDDDRRPDPKPLPAADEPTRSTRPPAKQGSGRSSNPPADKPHLQTVLERPLTQHTVTLRKRSQTVSATGNRGEGARAWTA